MIVHKRLALSPDQIKDLKSVSECPPNEYAHIEITANDTVMGLVHTDYDLTWFYIQVNGLEFQFSNVYLSVDEYEIRLIQFEYNPTNGKLQELNTVMGIEIIQDVTL